MDIDATEELDKGEDLDEDDLDMHDCCPLYQTDMWRRQCERKLPGTGSPGFQEAVMPI